MTSDRGSIFLEDAEILEHRGYEAHQYVLRVAAPRAAVTARPGSFAHIRCHDSVPLRRPLSIMRANSEEGWLEFLYKPLGAGLAKLAGRKPGERLSLLAPIGRCFSLEPSRPRVLALGGGVGIPPMVFVAEQLRNDASFAPLILMGSEIPFPFATVAGRKREGLPSGSAMALLEDWNVPSRLASKAGLAGSFDGFVTELGRLWLEQCPGSALAETQLLACGPPAMLSAVAALAAEFRLPCELAVEEFMACGVGGCAGCTLRVQTEQGPAMKRVCVDGPVFAARDVYPDLNWGLR